MSASRIASSLRLVRCERSFETQREISRFLSDYDGLNTLQKGSFDSPHLHPTYSVNLKLREVLSKGDSETIFLFITKHINSRSHGILSIQLIEEYLQRLLVEENVDAAVSLIHLLLHADRSLYGLSHQLWSLLASKSCELCHSSGASLIYHEVIDPITAYDDPEFDGLVNCDIPYLLFPDILARIASVLSRDGNYTAVLGVQQYFKRFYSYFWHRTIYRNIALAKVESLATAGLFTEALGEYVSLAWQHRGHKGLVKGSVVEHNLKHSVSLNSKARRKVIASTAGTSKPVEVEYNKYTLPGKGFNAIFDGVIRVADTPNFNNLVFKYVAQLMADRSSATERLVNFISSNHHALIRPVMAALCSQGLVFEAWSVVTQTINSMPRISKKVLFRGEEVFILIFRAIKNKAKAGDLSDYDSKQISDILGACRNLCGITSDRSWSYECRLAYLESLLALPSISRGEVRLFMFEWNTECSTSKHPTKSRLKLALGKKEYERLVSLNIGDSLLSSVTFTAYDS